MITLSINCLQLPGTFQLTEERVRTLERVVSDHLIPWAAKSIYSSVNQAAQPHAIVVINGEDISIPEDAWNYGNSTNQYLESLRTPFENDKNLASILADLPSDVAASINTHADLLEHYYSSVTIINVPQKSYLMRMDKQFRELYTVIENRCSNSYERKERSRSLLKAERLERVLAAAFDHFSQGNETPFNFLSESLWQSPIPGGLEDNMVRFFLAFQRSLKEKNDQHDAVKLFNMMTRIISSHIFLDTERYDIPG